MADNRKFWLVIHPLRMYEEDVKSLARQNNLRVVDAQFKSHFGDEFLADKVPKLTVLGGFKDEHAKKAGTYKPSAKKD